MDVFSRTFLPATAEAGLPIPLVSRHMPVLRRCVTTAESTVLVTICHRPGEPLAAAFLLLLTNRAMVVTRETRLLHRVQLHLMSELAAVRDPAWTPDPRLRSVELAATMPDGVRERFWIPVPDVRRVRHLDTLFHQAFRAAGPGPGGGARGGMSGGPTPRRTFPVQAG